MPTVLVTPPILRDPDDECFQVLRSAGMECRIPQPSDRQLVLSEVLANLDGIDAVLAGPEPYTAEVLDRFPQLRVISRAGVGYDAVDLEAASRVGIPVAITPGTNHDAVAEHAFALLLGMVRRVVPNHQMVVSGDFKRKMMQPLRGLTLGILGLGRIGRAVAERARAFKMNVVAFDPYADAAVAEELGIRLLPLDDVFACSDYLTLHSPLTPETQHLIREETIAKMKDGVMLVNTARGGLIDENALAAALRSGKIASVALDVFEQEPPVGSPMLTAPNTLLSPHVASMDTDAVNQMAVMAAQTIVDLYQGRWPTERLVNHDRLGPSWKW